MNPQSKIALVFLCLLSAVVCPPVRAGGSWLVDGQAVQSLEVQTTNDDPAALHTDGSRKMTAPLNFDSSASVPNSGILNAFIPWSGGYSDIFVMDEDEEVMWLASDQNVSFGVGSLFISSGQLTSFDFGSTINFEERSLGGGGWWVNSVLDDPNAIMSRSYADNRYVQQAGITSPLIFVNSLSSPVNGLFKAYVPWDAQYDFFAFNSTHETVVLSPTVDIGFEAGGLVMAGNKLELTGDAAVDFDEHRLGGGWWVDTVMDDPGAVMSRSYADNRYVRPDAVTSQLVFDNALSTPTNGLFKAYCPWDGVYDFFLFDEDEEAIHLSNGQAGFYPTEDLYIFGSTVGANGGGRIDFGEFALKGEGWGIDSVGPYDNCIISRSFADNRYVQQSAGITTNYTVQAGDVLQIQNGVITAINP